MEYRKFDSMYVLRMDKDDEVVETLKKFCTDNKINLGWVTGIGAVNKITIGLFETQTKRYISDELTGDFEITSLSGNISTMNNEVYIHCHACLSGVDHKTYGGHLNSAVVSATGEFIISEIKGKIDREFSDEIGLNLIKFL